MGYNKCFDLREHIPNEEQFWNHFSVLKSPGDGHCFIHSVSASVASMHPPECVSNAVILAKVKNEVLSYTPWYIPFVDGASMMSLLNGMHGYVDHKRYDTPFGDIVPHIVANALEVDIIIMCKNNINFSCNMVSVYLFWIVVCIMMLWFLYSVTHHTCLVSSH